MSSSATAPSALSNPSPQPRVALALSGGGFRATLFHLGVIAFLRDCGTLPLVTELCAVSGGSIIGAHLVSHWRDYTSDDDETFDRTASALIAFAKRDVRGRVLRRFLLRWPLRLLGSAPSRSDLLQDEYRALFADSTLAGTRDGTSTSPPRLHVLATNLTEGVIASFSPDGYSLVRGTDERLLDSDGIRIRTAVAASSAFPAFFEPLSLTADDLFVDGDQFGQQLHVLTDGGVFDNIGVRRSFSLLQREDIRHVIVSDAGALFESAPGQQFSGILRTALRSTDVLMKRVRDLEYERLGTFTQLPPDRLPQLLIVRIGDTPIPDPHFSGIPKAVHRAARDIRTDLDRFSPQEIAALLQAGYSLARCAAATSATWTTARPITRTAPWLPNELEPFRIGPKDTAVADELRASAQRRLRLFDSKDRAAWALLGVATLAALTILGSFAAVFYWGLMAGASLDDAFPHKYRVELRYRNYVKEWIAAQPEDVKQAIAAYDKGQDVGLHYAEAISSLERQRASAKRLGAGTVYVSKYGEIEQPVRWNGVMLYKFPSEEATTVIDFTGEEDDGVLRIRAVQRAADNRPLINWTETELTQDATGFTGSLLDPATQIRLGSLRLEAEN